MATQHTFNGTRAHEEQPVRLLTRLHLPFTPAEAPGFRVVADLVDRRLALVCLGATRAEVCARARALSEALPPETVGLRLQQWAGETALGHWQDVPCEKKELVPPYKRWRRREARQRRRSSEWTDAGQGGRNYRPHPPRRVVNEDNDN
jgi:hypothetical protein